MSSPEEPPKEPTTPKGDAANEPGGAPEPASGQRTGPVDADRPAGNQPGSRDQSSDDPELPRLAPIPPGGTTAPPDRERVFAGPGSAFPGAPTPAGPDGGWQRSTGSPSAAASASSPAGAQPTEEDLRKVRNRGRLALALGITSLLALVFFPLTPLLGIAAIVVGIIARRLARRASTISAGAVPGIVLGAVSTLIAAVLIVSMAVFWKEFTTYASCIEGANTHSAQNKCRDQLERSLEERMLSESR